MSAAIIARAAITLPVFAVRAVLYSLLLLPALGHAQAPQTLATYTWNGQARSVTTDDVALEMAPRHRRTSRGEETIAHLIDLHIVRTAADKKGLLPTDAEVRQQVAAYREAIKTQGRDPDQFLASKGVTESELADYTLLTLALDRLVKDQLGLSDVKDVTNEYRELWLRDHKKAAAVVTDAAQLPAGIVARTSERQFTMLDLGRVLCARSTASERQRFARQVILRRILDDEATAQGITVSATDCESAVARIRERAESDKGGGVTFGSMLEALGTTPAELSTSPVLRAQVIARQVLARQWPEEAVHRELARDGAGMRARYGARRRIEVLWLRASDTPNELIPRSFAAALEEAGKLRDQLARKTEGKTDGKTDGAPTTFAMLARVHSDDPRTKLKGGDAGWHHQVSEALPREVLDWAFAAPQGEASAPLRVADGVCLARVREIEPEPSLAVLRARLLEDREEGFLRELLDKAAVKMHEGT
jgi:parvulin-like peptidyl-prolyl isomerase